MNSEVKIRISGGYCYLCAMHLKEGFVLRELADVYIVVGEGDTVDFQRVISLNASAAYLWKSVEGREFDADTPYSQEMLREMLNINECFANRAAACFLMPGFLVQRVLKRCNDSKKVIIYDNNILAQDQKLLIQKMADTMGVSYTAFFYRLSELDLFERRPVEEYLHKNLHYGGEKNAVRS